MLPGTKTCLVCGTPLSLLDAPTAPLCRDPACGWTYRTFPKHQACEVCGRPLSTRELAGKVCGRTECRRARLVAQLRRQREELEAQARALRAEGAKAMRVESPEAYAVTLIPSFRATRLTRLPKRRVRALRERLRELIDEALAPGAAPVRRSDHAATAPPDAPPPDVAAVLGAACARCQGFCCRAGAEHAYLTPDNVRRYLATHPGAAPEDVLTAYLERVGHRTYRDSCIYHQADGCALPREMRSDTCNRFLCEGLSQFRTRVSAGAAVRAFVATTEHGRVETGAFVDARDVRVVRRADRREPSAR